ncbi:sigma-70 family RNA polymerase sigma factor [Streptomyces sp. NPDC052107]|uniref:sigma-70 family RNA polymerase sigma factor n=1 Tax=Streptomyces sp. NPDC052107 TaxID=3155632 RepID=UPI0034249819
MSGAALTELLIQLRRAAIDGVVPENVFAAQVRKLELGDSERERLREELARLRVPVQKSVVHANIDTPDVEKVASNREENVSPRLDRVLTLLDRYADTGGYVTSRACEGVIRLAGLDAREAAALRAAAQVRAEEALETTQQGAGADEGRVTDEDAAQAGEHVEEAWTDGPQEEPLPEPSQALVRTESDLAAAVASAQSVLEEDRFRRRPEKYLLAAQEEVGLSVLLRGGADTMAQEPDKDALSGLPPDDIRVRARDCLVLHNQRLVHKLVPRYLDQGLDYEDLFQCGVLGLMTAARKFDPAKGFKFSTYATWWIRQSIRRGIADEGNLIRIPVHMHEQVCKVALAERTLYGQGKPAGVVDIAVFCDMTVEKVGAARRLSRRTDSLDRVISDGATLGDFVGEKRPLPSVEHDVLNADLTEHIMSVMDTFPEREARILIRRLGLDGDEPATLEQLGQEFGVTRERIRQLYVKALPTLKHRVEAAGLVGAHAPEEETEPHAAQPERIMARPHRRVPVSTVVPRGQAQGAATEHRVVVGAAAAAAKKLSGVTDEGTATVPLVLPVGQPEFAHGGEPADVPGEPDAHVVDADVDLPTDTPARPIADLPAQADAALAPEPAHRPPAQREVSSPAAPKAEVGLDVEKETVSDVAGAAHFPQNATDWDKALQMSTRPFGGGVAWLAEYALLAVGHPQLTVLLGPSAADAVVRAGRARGMLDRPVVSALEVLQRVFDALKDAGCRPEQFFERPSEALVGMTPRAYLAARPLVSGESRLAVRDALREFTHAQAALPEGALRPDSATTSDDPRAESESASVAPLPQHIQARPALLGADAQPRADEAAGKVETSSVGAGAGTAPQPPSAQPPPGTDLTLAKVRAEHEAVTALLQQEHERRLTEERRAAEQRLEAAQAEAQRQVDAMEQTLLQRMDEALARQERHLRRQAEERIAELREEHREAILVATRRAEQAAEATSPAAAQRISWWQARANEAHQQRRQYREETQERITTLEAALRQAESQLAARDRAVYEAGQREAASVAQAQQRAEAAEQWAQALVAAAQQAEAKAVDAEKRAAARLAQAEHDARVRIAELQAQLAALQSPTAGRASLRDRWRRS